jgi:hypothetical protein
MTVWTMSLFYIAPNIYQNFNFIFFIGENTFQLHNILQRQPYMPLTFFKGGQRGPSL